MKILIDNNISHRITSLLNKTLADCAHVSDFNLGKNTDDITIWNFAKEKQYLILTKDNDFEAMSRLYGCPPKIIQLICGNKTTNEIFKLLEKKINWHFVVC